MTVTSKHQFHKGGWEKSFVMKYIVIHPYITFWALGDSCSEPVSSPAGTVLYLNSIWEMFLSPMSWFWNSYKLPITWCRKQLNSTVMYDKKHLLLLPTNLHLTGLICYLSSCMGRHGYLPSVVNPQSWQLTIMFLSSCPHHLFMVSRPSPALSSSGGTNRITQGF